MTERTNEALEKLNRGIRESRQTVQQQTMELAQEYFDDSVEELKQQVRENRATLENLPDQVPGGREESFQMLFKELMDNYSKIEECLAEAQSNVANLDTTQPRMGSAQPGRQEEEIEVSEAARREAQELGVDLTQVEGTGSGGRIVIWDVERQVERAGDTAAEQAASEKEVKASDAARRKAEELGLDLSRIGGSGSEGQITVNDVNKVSEEMKEQTTTGTGQVAQGAQDTAGQVAGQAQQTADGAAQGAKDAAGQVTNQAEQAAQSVQDTVGGFTGGGRPLGGVTDQVGQAAQGVRDTAGQAAGQAQQAAGQATEQAGQVAGQAQDAAGGAVQQAQDTAGESAGEPRATSAARRKAEEMGVDLSKVKGTGSGGLVTIKDVTDS